MKKILWSILLLTVFVSCTNDNDLTNSDVTNDCDTSMKLSVKIESLPTIESSTTRGFYGYLESDCEPFDYWFMGPFWDIEGEKFGICSLDGSINVPLSITSDFNLNGEPKWDFTASIDKQLVNGHEYIVYYPYSHGFLNVTNYLTCSYDNQDYYSGHYLGCFVSDKFVFRKGEVPAITLRPKNAEIIITTVLPQGSYLKIELENIEGGKPFGFLSRYFFAGNEMRFSDPSIFQSSSSLPLSFFYRDIVSGTKNYMTIKDENERSFYLASLPTITGKFVVKATTVDGNVYYSKNIFESKTFKAGYGYYINCEMQESKPNGMDISNPDKGIYEENGIYYIDLGTSVCWATLNVGAISPTDCGKKFGWGELVSSGCHVKDDRTVGITSNCNSFYKNDNLKTEYNREQYKWYVDNSFIKYVEICPYNFNINCNLPVLKAEDDVATSSFGEEWRTPSYNEMMELRNSCYWEYTSNYSETGVSGFIVFKAKNANDKGLLYDSNSVEASSKDYNINADVHIFLPNTSVTGCTSLSYMTNQSCWEIYKEGAVNDNYKCMFLSNVGIQPSVHFMSIPVYHGSVVRPVRELPVKNL